MYESFYGLRENAFSLTPDVNFLFLNARSNDALDRILYCIEQREGFSVIAGDIGTGKSTMCLALLKRLEEKNIRTAVIQNPTLSELDILITILHELGVRPESAAIEADAQSSPPALPDGSWMNDMSKQQLLDLLNRFLVERAQENAFTVLIIDEAQNLTLTLLEELQLLSNPETSPKKLLQIVFIGQLQLIHRLKSDSLRLLDQHIAQYFEIEPLSPEDTEKYIHHRLTIAGSPNGAHFSDGALRAIWRYSKGCPRLINLACDRALLAGYKEQTATITPQLVYRAVMDLQGVEAKGSRLFSPEWLRVVAAIIFGVALICLMGYWGVKWLHRTPAKMNFRQTREKEIPGSDSFKSLQNSDVARQRDSEVGSEMDLLARRKIEALKPSVKLLRIIRFGRTLELIGEVEAGNHLTVNDDPVEVSADGSFKHFTRPFPPKSNKIILVLKATNLAGKSAELVVPYDFNDRN